MELGLSIIVAASLCAAIISTIYIVLLKRIARIPVRLSVPYLVILYSLLAAVVLNGAAAEIASTRIILVGLPEAAAAAMAVGLVLSFIPRAPIWAVRTAMLAVLPLFLVLATPINPIITERLGLNRDLVVQLFDVRPDGTVVVLHVPARYIETAAFRTNEFPSIYSGVSLGARYPDLLAEGDPASREDPPDHWRLAVKLALRGYDARRPTSLPRPVDYEQAVMRQDARVDDRLGMKAYATHDFSGTAILVPVVDGGAPGFYFSCDRKHCNRLALSAEPVPYSYVLPLQELPHWHEVEAAARRLVDSFGPETVHCPGTNGAAAETCDGFNRLHPGLPAQ